jgi:uncharacterized C2H2 Zn-finger protein
MSSKSLQDGGSKKYSSRIKIPDSVGKQTPDLDPQHCFFFEYCDVFKVFFYIFFCYMGFFLCAGVKKFACPDCDKCFLQRNDLIKHSRIHTGHKPFRCDTCGAAFARNDYLKKHRVLHLNPEGSTCPVCKELFSTDEGMRKHMKAKHSSPAKNSSGMRRHLNNKMLLDRDSIICTVPYRRTLILITYRYKRNISQLRMLQDFVVCFLMAFDGSEVPTNK